MINRLICCLKGHKQSPVIEQRQWRKRNGRHIRFEYQCECDRCGVKSKWIRWKHYPNPPDRWKEMYT